MRPRAYSGMTQAHLVLVGTNEFDGLLGGTDRKSLFRRQNEGVEVDEPNRLKRRQSVIWKIGVEAGADGEGAVPKVVGIG
jgi:hypothetical protein